MHTYDLGLILILAPIAVALVVALLAAVLP